MHRSFSFALLLSLAVITLDQRARAESPAQEPSAQAKYRSAMDAIDRKDWPEARRILLALWERAQTYDVAASLSQVEFQLGNFAASARYVNFAIVNAAPMESPARLESYKGGLNELRPKVATLHIVISDPGARLAVDGVAVPPLGPDAETFVEPGTHTIEATAPSGSAVARTVNTVAGERYEVAFTIKRPNSSEPTPATPHIASRAEGGPASNPTDVSTRSKLNLVPVYVGAGLAAGGAMMALGFGIAANNARSDWQDATREAQAGRCFADKSAQGCGDVRESYDRQRRNADFARVGVGVFVGASVATVAYVLLWPRTKETSPAARSLLPMVSPRAVGVVGTF